MSAYLRAVHVHLDLGAVGYPLRFPTEIPDLKRVGEPVATPAHPVRPSPATVLWAAAEDATLPVVGLPRVLGRPLNALPEQAWYLRSVWHRRSGGAHY